MSEPKSGDRVRAVVEGLIFDSGPNGLFFRIHPGDRAFRVADAVSVEVLEPAWEFGDIVKDALGVEYKRGHRGWLLWASTNSVDDSHPTRPLTLLVRGGEPVTP